MTPSIYTAHCCCCCCCCLLSVPMLYQAELVYAGWPAVRFAGTIRAGAHLHESAHSCADAITLSSPHSTTRACPLVRTLQLNSLPSDGSSQYFHASGSGCRASKSLMHSPPASPAARTPGVGPPWIEWRAEYHPVTASEEEARRRSWGADAHGRHARTCTARYN